ncbi:MAG: MoaD/ThiS family protein [Chitinophagaceae bacterium]
MKIKVNLLGQLADIAGRSTLELEGITDTETLQEKIHADFPALLTSTYRIAVGNTIVTENTPLQNGTVISLLPPFSGG